VIKEDEKLISDYRQYLFDSGLAEKTIVSYVSDIRHYRNFLEGIGEHLTLEMKRHHIVQYKKKLINENKSVATINKAINSLYSYNGYLKSINSEMLMVVNVSRDKVKVARGSESEVEVFSDEEIARILDEVINCSIRDKLIVYILLYTGIRVSELVGIRVSDVDVLSRQLKIMGKGGKMREIYLRKEILDTFDKYVRNERASHAYAHLENLLLSQRGPLKADGVNKLLNRLGEKLGIDIFPHKFRHTVCSQLIKRGVDIVTVAKITGHANINTTAQYYVNVSKKDKQNAIDLL